MTFQELDQLTIHHPYMLTSDGEEQSKKGHTQQ